MADYKRIIKYFPPVRDYIRNRQWVKRGDVIAYAPGNRSEHFTTDTVGFRRTVFNGKSLSLPECMVEDRYAMILGSSHVFGFGLQSDKQTFASRLSDIMGFPFASVVFPEADTRTLHSVLYNIVSSAPNKPNAIILTTGGDLTRFCYTGAADPLFGSPNMLDKDALESIRLEEEEASLNAAHDAMLSASRIWIRAIIEITRQAGVAIIMADDTTFMDKQTPDAVEIDCKLGIAIGTDQQRRFDLQRRYGSKSYRARQEVADRHGVNLIGPDKNQVGFIDEFHYRADSIEDFSNLLASGLVGMI